MFSSKTKTKGKRMTGVYDHAKATEWREKERELLEELYEAVNNETGRDDFSDITIAVIKIKVHRERENQNA